MQKLIYIALIPLCINLMAGHRNVSASVGSGVVGVNDPAPLSLQNLVVDADKVSTPNTVDFEDLHSPDSYDLGLLVKWSKIGGCNLSDSPYVADDVVDSDERSFFMTCAALLKPYMQKPQSLYGEEEKGSFQQIVTQIKEQSKPLLPTQRYKIAQQLNVLAMFEGKLTFFQTAGRGRNSVRETVVKTLADMFRLGKNRRYPMQLQCAQIASKAMTSEEATLTLCDQWENEGILDKRVKSSKRRLKSNGFYRYWCANDEIIELLTYRSDCPRAVEGARYGDKQIKRFCKRIRKKVRGKHQYIENAARLLTEKWKSDGVLNQAVEDCEIKVNRARLASKAVLK